MKTAIVSSNSNLQPVIPVCLSPSLFNSTNTTLLNSLPRNRISSLDPPFRYQVPPTHFLNMFLFIETLLLTLSTLYFLREDYALPVSLMSRGIRKRFLDHPSPPPNDRIDRSETNLATDIFT
ncbi:hypothetical protein AVEN_3904-1 [Araneus ventricosus]|uniref:Uncharacterized protein n=1 Tax=Araneus ventricosus TaxID=182803 RepID=A0A4Y2J9T0_ARAVE|nr:hypothetical protein AVEN_3904-1 [Araneus ventricosus]